MANSAGEAGNRATDICPKRRLGCLGCFAGCGAVLLVLFVLLGAFVTYQYGDD